MRRFLFKNIFSYIALVFIYILHRTYRIRIINDHIESKILRDGQHPIYISWHQRFFPGILFLSSRKPIAIIVSKSRDGDLAAKVVELLGWRPIRGSSSKDGAKAFNQIKELAESGYSLGHIVDGPRGPFGQVKPGLLMLARDAGMPILPVIISARKKWVFNSWDNFIIPKPFSDIIVMFEREIYISKDSTKENLEIYKADLELKLHRFYKEADKYWMK